MDMNRQDVYRLSVSPVFLFGRWSINESAVGTVASVGIVDKNRLFFRDAAFLRQLKKQERRKRK